jgi:hypothetical protein
MMAKDETRDEAHERGQEGACCVCCEPAAGAGKSGKGSATVKCGPFVLHVKVAKSGDCCEAECEEGESSTCCE